MRHLIFIFCVWTAFSGGSPLRATGHLDGLATGTDVRATLSSPFTDLPPGGAVPFQIDLRNDQSSTGTWHVIFSNNQTNSSYEQNLTVAPHTSGLFNVVVPLPDVAMNRGSMTVGLFVKISGPGFENSNMPFFAYFNTEYNNPKSPFTLIGKGVLGPDATTPLENLYEKSGQGFAGSPVDATNLPTDWRGYAGVAAIILTETEWRALTPAQYEAMCDYVAQGGQLTLVTDNSSAGPGRLPIADGKAGPYGFGNIFIMNLGDPRSDGTAPLLKPENIQQIIQDHNAITGRTIDDNFATWSLRQMISPFAVSSTFILTFVFILGTLIGPVNLFAFARGSKRFRLFWTTPLISLVASVILVTGILMTEGIGGTGKQMIAIFSLPESNSEAVIQEQVARAAVLFSGGWHDTQNYLITPISAQSLDSGSIPVNDGMHYRSFGSPYDSSSDSYHQNEDYLSGDWFRSRTITGQYLQAIRPSRSTLSVLNASAIASRGDAPIILSSFPDELTEIHLIDQDGRSWTCRELEPGRKKTCIHCTEYDHDQFWSEACKQAGGVLRPILTSAAKRNGYFYATGTLSPSETLTTTTDIHWQVENAVYLGKWVDAPEAGP